MQPGMDKSADKGGLCIEAGPDVLGRPSPCRLAPLLMDNACAQSAATPAQPRSPTPSETIQAVEHLLLCLLCSLLRASLYVQLASCNQLTAQLGRRQGGGPEVGALKLQLLLGVETGERTRRC